MNTARWGSVALVAIMALTLSPAPSWADTATDDHTILVTFDHSQSNPAAAAKAAVEHSGGRVVATEGLGNKIAAVTVKASDAQSAAVEDRTEDQTGVKTAELSGKVYPTTTNDSYYSYLWNVNNASGSAYGTKAESAWPMSTGAGSVIGVIDTGITRNVDLNAHVIAGYDFVDGDTNPTDSGPDYATYWHGTHVAGIAAGIAKNGVGTFGVAPGASIEPIRMLGPNGGSTDDLVAAILWGSGVSQAGASVTNAHRADVLNLSLGSSTYADVSCPTAVQTAINQAVAAGTTVVVAAGNDSMSLAGTYPANCSNVIRVTASGNRGKLAGYSNYGTSAFPATVSAPGGSATSGDDPDPRHWILSTWPNSYQFMVGTSMAAPHVSGVIALLRARNHELTPQQLTSLVSSHVTRLSDGCSTVRCGPGITNAATAVAHISTPSLTAARVSGTARVGRRVTAVATTPLESSHLRYQWLRNGTAIKAATGRTYRLTTSDYKAAVSVRVQATASARSVQRTSAAVSVAAGTFVRHNTPKVRGTMRVGRTLSVYRGSWSPQPTGYRYQWLRDGKPIPQATGSTYRLTASDRGHRISVRLALKVPRYLTRVTTSAKRFVR
jgi:serine protease